MYFYLDTKVPKNQDLYRNSLENRPCLLKFRNSLRSNSRNFFTQARPVFTLRDGNFSNGRENKTRNGEDTGIYVLHIYFFVPLALMEIAGPKDGNLAAYIKKFVLFER
jgi:hypothetical protein